MNEKAEASSGDLQVSCSSSLVVLFSKRPSMSLILELHVGAHPM